MAAQDNRTVGTYQPTDAPERAPQAARVDVAAMVAGYKGDANAAQAEAFDPTPSTWTRARRTCAPAA
jgi:zinc protease